jgi:hypothetical protein
VPGAGRVHRDVEPAAATAEGVRTSVPDTVVVALIARQGNLRGRDLRKDGNRVARGAG